MAKKKVVKKVKKVTKGIKKVKVIKPVKKQIKKLYGVRDVENSTRDFVNWLAVFKTEYDIAPEAYTMLHEKMDDFSAKVGMVTCDIVGTVDKNKMRIAANSLRDIKAWLAVFAKEYDLADEAVCVLTEKLDEVGTKLANVECG